MKISEKNETSHENLNGTLKNNPDRCGSLSRAFLQIGQRCSRRAHRPVVLEIDHRRNAMPNLSKEALTQKIYENKCAHPSLEDILNCFCELQCSELVSLFHDLASVLHQAWHAENIELSASIRERCQQDFLEVSDIEALGAEQPAAAWRIQKNAIGRAGDEYDHGSDSLLALTCFRPAVPPAYALSANRPTPRSCVFASPGRRRGRQPEHRDRIGRQWQSWVRQRQGVCRVCA